MFGYNLWRVLNVFGVEAFVEVFVKWKERKRKIGKRLWFCEQEFKIIIDCLFFTQPLWMHEKSKN
jgi:hypothetical protein